MDIEVIQHEDDLRRLGIALVHESTYLCGEIDGAPLVRDIDESSAGERLYLHEDIGGATSLVFVIDPLGLSGGGGQRRGNVGNQLLGGFVKANHWVTIQHNRA